MYLSASPRERAASALAASAIVLGIACALVFGLRVGQGLHAPGTLISVILAPDKPPPPPQPRPSPRPAVKSAAKGDPAPRNLHNKAAQVVAPPPPIRLIVPPPVPVATQQAGLGSAASNGASDRPGPGQGAGGLGNGLGGGGDGGDGNGRPVTGPRQIKGKLSFSDLPDELLREGDSAAVGVRYVVEPDGTVSHCLADEPSGIAALDRLTCRLIEQRFRFRPARDRAGLPVRSTIAETHSWFRRSDDS